jgi:ribose-phosphate pyrophosphokinase
MTPDQRDALTLFAPAASKPFASKVAAMLGISLAPSEEREFEGGEHKMRPLCDVLGRRVFVVHALHGDEQQSANDKLCRLLFFIGALKDAGAAHVTACVPYFAYARKDRRTKARDPVTTRYVAGMFESVGTDRVIVLDIHNDAAFDNSFRIETMRLESAAVFSKELTSYVGTDLLVASPDAGGMKRAHQFQTFLQEHFKQPIGAGFMEKIRSSGQLSGDTFVGDVRGREVIIYDDMIASGSTLIRATRAAREGGATRVHAVATHAVFTPQAKQLFEPAGPDQVWVSDSIEVPPAFAEMAGSKLRVCSIAPLFAETIRYLTAHGSG